MKNNNFEILIEKAKRVLSNGKYDVPLKIHVVTGITQLGDPVMYAESENGVRLENTFTSLSSFQEGLNLLKLLLKETKKENSAVVVLSVRDLDDEKRTNILNLLMG